MDRRHFWIRRCAVVATATASLVLACLNLKAADPTFVGKLAIAVSDEGAKRLGLSDEVKQQLLDLIDRREQQALSTALDIKDLPPQQIAAKLAPFVAESERQGMALLTVEQRAKLDQLRVAQAGMGSLAETELAKVLGLTEDQKKQVTELLEARSQALTRGGENDRRIARDEFERKLAALLTSDQRATWEKMAGLADQKAPATVANAPNAEAPAPAATAAAKSPPSNVAETSPPKSKNEPPSPSDTAKSEAPDTRPWADGEVRLKFNFHHTPWDEVLKWLADEADLALHADPAPQGTCNYWDTRSYTTAEAIDVINSILVTKGYMLVRHERLLMLHNLEDPLPPQLVQLVTVDELQNRGEFELVKCLFPLSKLEPTEAEAEIAKLVGPQGSIVVLPKSRQLLVTETGGRLRAIKRVLDEVENPSGGRTESIRQLTLQNVGVEDFLTIARPLLEIPDGQNSSADLRLAIDPFGPRIFATGKNDALRRLEEILPMVDRPVANTGGPLRPIEQPQLETYQIGKADPATVKNVLSTLLAGLPEVRLDVDPVNNKVIALARPSEHRTIIETLKQLEGTADRIEVIQLRRLDPQLVILSINKLFSTGNEKDKNATSSAPKVDGDPTSMKLWVRGTSEQITQVKDLVEKLEGPSAAQSATERQPLRFLPLTGSSSRQTLDSIEALWPAVRTNKIRVVTPSAISPTLREQRPGSTRDSRDAQAPTSAPDEQQPPAQLQLRGTGEEQPPTQIRIPLNTLKNKSAAATRTSAFRLAAFDGQEQPVAGEPRPNTEPAQSVPSNAVPSSTDLQNVPADPDSQPNAESKGKGTSNANSKDPPEIVVTITPQGIFIASQDLDALDDFEQLLKLYIEQRGVKSGEPTVFWLKYARAEVAAELLTQVITGNTGDTGGGGGSLLGDMASSMLGDSGGLLGGLLGLGGSGGGSTYTGPTTIVPDVRLNALIVQGRPQDIMLIDQLLPIVDREASPEEVLTAGKPRLIPVVYMAAEEMANIVRQVFADRVAGSTNNQQRQPNPEDFIRALRGGGGRSRSENRGEVAKMSIGVDPRSNSLIVAASETLFSEVEAMVRQLDQEGSQTDDSMMVVTIKNSNPTVLQKALTSITGGQIKANTQSATPSPSSSSSSGQGSSSSNQPQSNQFNPDDIRARMEMFRRMQEGGSRSSPFGGPSGGFSRGGFPGGGFPGGFQGGGDRGGGDRGGGDRGGDRGGGGDRRGR
jgi:type II secretory pathway component GspD/PulD (secretin)